MNITILGIVGLVIAVIGIIFLIITIILSFRKFVVYYNKSKDFIQLPLENDGECFDSSSTNLYICNDHHS